MKIIQCLVWEKGGIFYGLHRSILLLYKNGYMVGQYISIEKAIADTKESYYDVPATADQGWHTDENDSKEFIKYMLGIILSCYREFESRVGFAWQSRAKNTLCKKRRVDLYQYFGHKKLKDYAQTLCHMGLLKESKGLLWTDIIHKE